MNALITVGCAVAVGFGIWLAIQTATGNVLVGRRSELRPRSERSESAGSVPAAFIILAVALAVAVLLATRLVVAAAAAGLAVVLIPKILTARAERETAIAKMRASAEYVEAIRGSLGAGSGLEAAIIEAAERPPRALEVELGSFVENTRSPEVSTAQALYTLAQETREPAIDLLVGSLLAALRGAAGDMGQLFERIADQGRDFAETRAHTQAERAKVEFQTKVLSLLVVGVALLSVLVSPDLTSAYDASPVGQFRLTIPIAVFGFGWWWLNRLNRVESQYRFRLRQAVLA